VPIDPITGKDTRPQERGAPEFGVFGRDRHVHLWQRPCTSRRVHPDAKAVGKIRGSEGPIPGKNGRVRGSIAADRRGAGVHISDAAHRAARAAAGTRLRSARRAIAADMDPAVAPTAALRDATGAPALRDRLLLSFSARVSGSADIPRRRVEHGRQPHPRLLDPHGHHRQRRVLVRRPERVGSARPLALDKAPSHVVALSRPGRGRDGARLKKIGALDRSRELKRVGALVADPGSEQDARIPNRIHGGAGAIFGVRAGLWSARCDATRCPSAERGRGWVIASGGGRRHSVFVGRRWPS
jgi:hypothetical protein